MMSRWSVFFKERFPILPNALIALGMVNSSQHLSEKSGGGAHSAAYGIACFGGLLFLAQIRFMDEVKDFEKDKIAHPDRPLPKGLFHVQEFSNFIRIFNFAMYGVAWIAGILLGMSAGIWFALGTFYLHLMFKEFYLGKWLSDRPLLYAISHQAVIFPMTAFVMACFNSQLLQSHSALWFSGVLLFAFFGFEVGRKLDPQANPILQTYLKRFGRERTAFLLVGVLGLSYRAGVEIGLGWVLGPVFILVSLLTSLLWWAPQKFKWIEGFVALYLLIAIWGVPLSDFFGRRQP